MNREHHAELATAVEERPDWKLDPFKELSQLNSPAYYLPGNRSVWGQVFGPHLGRDGWSWSVWRHQDPARGLLDEDDPERTAADAVKAVEDLVTRVIKEHS